MDVHVIILCLLFAFIECLTRINNDFNTNIFDDETEYTLIDPDSAEYLGNGLEHYFRQIRSMEEDYKNVETIDTQEYFRELPKPEFLRGAQEINEAYNQVLDEFNDRNLDYEEINEDRSLAHERRTKRSSEDKGNFNESQEETQNFDDFEKPLEVIILDISNGTENGFEIKELNELHSESEDDALKINDFIRFKRDIQNESESRSDDDKSRPKREGEEKEKRDNIAKEQWTKQAYSTAKNGEHKLDDNLRVPQVHFVTQRRSESAPLPVFYNYDRNPRSRDIGDDYDKGYYSRFPRHYEPYQNPYRNNYYRDEYPRDAPPQYENERNYYYEQPVYRQRRIIYYATLPEVVRSPSTGDLGDRYNYRDSYETDSRYARIPLQNVPRVVDPYRYRKPYAVDKSNYGESGPVKGAYPLKVSTDVNVKEIKKNPERRIYSEGDRRYNYGPYQPMERYDPFS